jgi:hypothetical protein
MSNRLLDDFLGFDAAALAVAHGVSMDVASVRVGPITSLGPAIELACFAQVHRHWSSFSKRSLPQFLATPLRTARRHPLRPAFQSDGDSEIGFLCFSAVDSDTLRPSLFEFDLRARDVMKFRRNVGSSKGLVCGAIGEMVDNVFEHSGRAESGIAAFLATRSYVDIAVADVGFGVLSSLRQNPAYAYLSDSGMALSLAIRDGTSRYSTTGDGEGRGHGFSTLFRGLNSLDAEIRLRSGNYALEVGGQGVNERAPTISEKAELTGLVVTFRTYF